MTTAAIVLSRAALPVNSVAMASSLNPAILSMVLVGFACSCRPQATVTGPVPQEAYVWQRVWNESVRAATLDHSPSFKSLVVLSAEVSWKAGQPSVVRADLDFETLRLAKCPVGIALRVGPFAGPFSSRDNTSAVLADLAASLVTACTSNEVRVSELQIDFDCASSKLDGYRDWIEAIREKTHGIRIVITALPAWLNEPGFRRLIAAVDGYVLQVHSLERPKSPEAEFSLCDPRAAHRTVQRAARLGKPFRVALPTYGYVIAFDRQKRFLGLSADGPELIWPEGAILRETRAEADAMATLIKDWTIERPQELTGVIWYRLPVAGESLNWSWPTLAAVMAGRVPKASVRVEATHPRPGLIEVALVNDGEHDSASLPAIELRWQKARMIAGDGLAGFRIEKSTSDTVHLATRTSSHLKPGERRKIGWLRLDKPETQVNPRIL